MATNTDTKYCILFETRSVNLGYTQDGTDGPELIREVVISKRIWCVSGHFSCEQVRCWPHTVGSANATVLANSSIEVAEIDVNAEGTASMVDRAAILTEFPHGLVMMDRSTQVMFKVAINLFRQERYQDARGMLRRDLSSDLIHLR
jgi:hypothetical protein